MITDGVSLNWRTTLKFPPYPRLSKECTDLLVSLLCEPEDRLGSSSSSLGGGRSAVLSTRQVNGLGKGGDDGAETIKRHAWFSGIDWDSRCPFFHLSSHYHSPSDQGQTRRHGLTGADLHKQTPPYVPELATDDDTRYFDEDIPDEVGLSTHPPPYTTNEDSHSQPPHRDKSKIPSYAM